MSLSIERFNDNAALSGFYDEFPMMTLGIVHRNLTTQKSFHSISCILISRQFSPSSSNRYRGTQLFAFKFSLFQARSKMARDVAFLRHSTLVRGKRPTAGMIRRQTHATGEVAFRDKFSTVPPNVCITTP